MNMEIESQNKKILKHLESGKSITGLDALYQFGCFRLGARIYDLRRQGAMIECEMVEVTSPSVYNGKKHFARYKLIK
jgi:hypothetical protein